MQEKKNIRLLILLGMLSIATMGVHWLSQRTKGFEVDKDLFRVAELGNIDEVIMESGGKKVVLKFDGTRWMANDYVADRNMIDVLFATMAQAEPKRPLANALRDSVSNTLRSEGVHVSLFSDGNVVKEFYAGGNPQKTQAYFLGSDATPYYMLIPGYRVYVSGIFELHESDWRDKYVFGFNWRNFKSLSVGFPDQPQQNFQVSNADRFFGIEGIKTDTTRLNDFLDQVSLLTVDQYLQEIPEATTLPAVTISVFTIGDREYKLALFSMPEKRQYQGLVNGHSGALFSAAKITPLLRGKDYYRVKEGQ